MEPATMMNHAIQEAEQRGFPGGVRVENTL